MRERKKRSRLAQSVLHTGTSVLEPVRSRVLHETWDFLVIIIVTAGSTRYFIIETAAEVCRAINPRLRKRARSEHRVLTNRSRGRGAMAVPPIYEPLVEAWKRINHALIPMGTEIPG